MYLKKTRPCDDVLALHVDKLLYGKALVIREVDEQRLRHNLEVFFNSDENEKMPHQVTRDSSVFLHLYNHGLDFGDELTLKQLYNNNNNNNTTSGWE